MKINLDQVSAEQKLGLTKVRKDLFLMLINPIAPKLTVPNGAQLYSDTLKQTIKNVCSFGFGQDLGSDCSTSCRGGSGGRTGVRTPTPPQ